MTTALIWLVALALQATEPKVPEPSMLWLDANRAYDSGEYARAHELYTTLVDSGFANGHLYFNLGNTQLRQGQLGAALASYLTARALLPRDSDIRANLSYARKLSKDALVPPEPNPVLATLFFWHVILSRHELWVFTMAANLLFWTLAAAAYRWRHSEALRFGAGFALLILLAVGISLAVRYVSPTQVAVVQTEEVEVHAGLSRDAVVRFKLHAGSEVRVQDVMESWVRVRLPDGLEGFVERADVAVVSW